VRLLTKANMQSFKEALTKAGLARKYYLTRARDEGGVESRRRATRYGSAALSCLAANSRSIAYEIAKLSTESWLPKAEYEDDYCFFRFVNLMIRKLAGESIDDEIQIVLDRFGEVLAEGGPPGRYEICLALHDLNRDEFVSALNNRIEELIVENDRMRETLIEPGLDLFLFWPSSFVSIEIIAMIRLAAWNSMSAETEFALCPSVIIEDTDKISVEDPFVELDRIRLAAN